MSSPSDVVARAKNNLGKNVRFGVARALTQTAKAVSQELNTDMAKVFDRPTPFTSKAVGFTPANKQDLKATVFVKDEQAKYLVVQETGGERLGKTGSPINLPVGQRINQYGNIARGAIGREKAKTDTFVADGRTPRTKHLPPGLYRRPKYGKRRDGGIGTKGGLRHKGVGKAVGGRAAKGATGLKLLVSFKARAEYKARFQFVSRGKAAAKSLIEENVAKSVTEAMRTGR